MIERGKIGPEPLLELCARMLRENGIPAFGDRSLQWLVPFEVVEEYIDPSMENRIFGYPVRTEALLPESSVVLVETIDWREIGPLV